MPASAMNLKILLPSCVFKTVTGVSRMVVETRGGSVGFLPQGLDCVASLVPGILTYEAGSGGEASVALDEGVLVKSGPDVLVSVRRAVSGTDLGLLRGTVAKEFLALDGQEKNAHSAAAQWEAGFLRSLADFKHE